MALPRTQTLERVNGDVTTTFAARPLTLRNRSDQTYLRDVILTNRTASARNWQWYSKLGVIRYALNRAARIAGSATIHLAHVDADGNMTGAVDPKDPQFAAGVQTIKGVYSRVDGLRGLIQRYFLCMKIPADSILIRVKEGGQDDGYMFLSTSELGTGSDGQAAYDSSQTLGELTWTLRPGSPAMGTEPELNPRVRKVAKTDVLGRVWMPSPQWIEAVDSPLTTLDPECDLLFNLMNVMRARTFNRAISNGFVTFPNTLNVAVPSGIQVTPGASTADKIQAISEHNARNAEQGGVIQVGPVVLSVPEALMGKAVEFVNQEAGIDERDLALRNELREAILFGLDINVAKTTEKDTNHFSAWSDSAEEIRLAVAPDLDSFCWTIDRLILRPALRAAGWDETRIASVATAYDISAASVRINRQEDARKLRDKYGIKMSTNRAVAGFTEQDAPDNVEYIRQFGADKGIPYLATFQMPEQDEFDWEKITSPGGKPSTGESDGEVQPGVGDPGSPSPDDDKTD